MSDINVDHSQIKAALTQELAQKSAWQDLLTTSTGDALLDFVATSATFAVFANERGLQEAFLDSAKMSSSIISSLRQLGVRVSRKLPASASIRITKPADGHMLSIPPYSAWKSGNIRLYNRDVILFPAGINSVTAVLYEGYTKTVYATGLGTPFQTFVAADRDFVAADSDVVVTVGGVNIPVVTDGLWHYKATVVGTDPDTTLVPTAAVRDSTTKDGELELTFGNTNYGTQPRSDQDVVISYCITTGATGNNATFTGDQCTCSDYPTVVGTALTALVGGSNERDLDSYRRIGPGQFAAFDRAVNEVEYNSVGCGYPGVVDAQLWGQRKLAPYKVEYMNAVRLCLLTTTVWGPSQREDYLTWLRKRTMAYMRFFWVEPHAKEYAVKATLYCESTANLSAVYTKAKAAVDEAVRTKYGWLGRTLYKSEIYDAIRESDSSIKYVKLVSPATDVVTHQRLPDISVVEGVGGTIPKGVVTYYISSVVSVAGVGGESLAEPLSVTVVNNYNELTHTATLTLSWDRVTGIDQYKIYTTRNGVTGLLATISGSATSWTDTGATPVAAELPQVDTLPVRFPSCTSVTLNMAYASDRGIGTM